MITGVHAVVFASQAEADAARAFFRDVLELDWADAGGGWPIFALPPAELAVHPDADGGRHELYLMRDDIDGVLAELEEKGVEIAVPVSDEGWGLLARVRVPGLGELGVYEPRHPTPLGGADA